MAGIFGITKPCFCVDKMNFSFDWVGPELQAQLAIITAEDGVTSFSLSTQTKILHLFASGIPFMFFLHRKCNYLNAPVPLCLVNNQIFLARIVNFSIVFRGCK